MDATSAPVLRVAVPDDAAAVTDAHEACWREAYADLLDPAFVDSVFADRATRVADRRLRLASGPPLVVAEVGSGSAAEVVGFVNAGPARHDDAPHPLELRALYTRRATWGTGLGAALLRAGIADSPAYLFTLAGNDRAIAFYAKHGFAADGGTFEHPGGLQVRMVRG